MFYLHAQRVLRTVAISGYCRNLRILGRPITITIAPPYNDIQNIATRPRRSAGQVSCSHNSCFDAVTVRCAIFLEASVHWSH